MKFTFIIALFMLVAGSLCEVKTEKANKRSKEEETPRLIAVAGNGEAEKDAEQPKRLVCYLNFELKPETSEVNFISDKSGYENGATMFPGGEILKFQEKDFTCNQAARLWESRITFQGDVFQAKPKNAITIAAWIKLEKKEGQHSIFSTIGSTHNKGQYHFEVNDGVLRWFHRNECENTIFETMAHAVPTKKWTHVAGTYDSKTSQAKVFIDGELRNQSIGQGELSTDWKQAAVIGSHGCPVKIRPLEGSIDEFRIYNYALKLDEIKALVGACRGDDSSNNQTADAATQAEGAAQEAKGAERRKKRSLIKAHKKTYVPSTKSCSKKRSLHLDFKRVV